MKEARRTLYLRHLELRDFRSWAEGSFDFSPGVSLFVGRNGYGKTNVIEAVGYLAHLASHRVNHDSPLVRQGAEDARISAITVNQGRELTSHLLIKPHAANLAQINRTRLKSPRDLLGVTYTVLFAPEDLSLVRGEPAERRKYLDELLAARTPRQAGIKADYDRVLRQRNALLKSAASTLRRGYDDDDGASALSTLDVWDSQLASFGSQVVAARLELVDQLNHHIAEAYSSIAPESRPASVAYRSTVDESISTLVSPGEAITRDIIEAAILTQLAQLREREIDRGTSLIGPHRDDLDLFLGDQPAKGFASHGESWSYALSLRLAEFSLLKESIGADPILILDDVFAELDAKRRQKLVAVAQEATQVLITAAVGDDLPDRLSESPITRFNVVTEDTPQGRVSHVAEVN